MSTYRQVVYMIMDYLKNSSDDAYYNPDHVLFLVNHFRAYVLKSKYENGVAHPSDQNYQTIHLTLEEVNAVDGFPCEGKYLRTVEEVPDKMGVGICSVYAADFLAEGFTWVSPQRFRFVGYNKWLRNTIYVTKGDDGHLYLKSCNPQLYYLKNLNLRGIFSDPLAAAVVGQEDAACEPLDIEFPLEDNLLPLLMQYVVKELQGGIYKPQDDENNASDDLSTLAQFIRSYMKTPMRRQIEG